MWRVSLVACALIASATCAARPMIIHQSQSLQPPAGYYFFGYELAIDGDWAIVIAGTPSATPAHPQETHDALLYHRVNGVWTLDRTLVHRVSNVYGQSPYFVSVAMSNGLAAIGSNPTRIFKRTNNTWAEIAHPFTAPEGDPDYVWGELLWDGNTLLASRSFCSYSPHSPWGAIDLAIECRWELVSPRAPFERRHVLRPGADPLGHFGQHRGRRHLEQ